MATRLFFDIAAGDSYESRFSDLDRRLGQTKSRVAEFNRESSRFGGQFGSRLQQVGFQVGDFAVQVASGQSALRAFIQQGTQVAGAFGPAGAIVGAAGAVVGAFATSMFDAGDASDEASSALDDARIASGGLESAMSALTGVVDTYVGAIADTATTQRLATNSIIADTRREFEAKRELLNLDRFADDQERTRLRRQVATLEERAGEIAARPDQDTLERRARQRRSIPQEFGLPDDARNEVIDTMIERAREAGDVGRELRRARVEFDEIDDKIRAADALLAKSFDDLVADASSDLPSGRSGGARGRGGSGRSGGSRIGGRGLLSEEARAAERAASAFERLRERIVEKAAASRDQITLIGLEGEARDRQVALLEAEKLRREVLTEATAAGAEVGQREIDQVNALVDSYADLEVKRISQAAAIEREQSALEESRRNLERLADDGIGRFADSLTSAEGSFRSFAGSIVDIGRDMANRLIVEALDPLKTSLLSTFSGAGSGLFGSALGLLGVGGGRSTFDNLDTGGLISLFSAKGNAFDGGGHLKRFASGGIVSGATLFGYSGGVGLMGEAGPEAIMPLARGPGGRLGVEARGGVPGLHLTQHFDMRGANVSESRMRQIAQDATQRGVSALMDARRDDHRVLA